MMENKENLIITVRDIAEPGEIKQLLSRDQIDHVRKIIREEVLAIIEEYDKSKNGYVYKEMKSKGK